eukprot:CAMPEP_0182580970 /NCGR_PEP_ID=MMETSP1324-20130603/48640_1 /TAXON_ID=236786 /ORGANISM="Florenciella sp., Strain RCC1587" /LENGTH=69 /DNA_ID=CAMNT_0024797267 /DNA_START=20 /DNA_END=226 /DNA_ORIENTATION=+
MMLDSYDLNGMRNGINGTHPPSGLDPPGIKVRPAQGFEATDYVIGGYWVWAKLVENLADIGYDMNSMAM